MYTHTHTHTHTHTLTYTHVQNPYTDQAGHNIKKQDQSANTHLIDKPQQIINPFRRIDYHIGRLGARAPSKGLLTTVFA